MFGELPKKKRAATEFEPNYALIMRLSIMLLFKTNYAFLCSIFWNWGGYKGTKYLAPVVIGHLLENYAIMLKHNLPITNCERSREDVRTNIYHKLANLRGSRRELPLTRKKITWGGGTPYT